MGTRLWGREVACPTCKICRAIDACALRRAVLHATPDVWRAAADKTAAASNAH